MKRTSTQFEPDDDAETQQKVDRIFREAKANLVHGFACSTGEFEMRRVRNRKQANHIKRVLGGLKDVHSLHATVYKKSVPVKFNIDMDRLSSFEWSKLPPGEGRCLIPLTDIINILPESLLETDDGLVSPLEELDTSEIVLHALWINESESTFPGRLMLCSNIQKLIRDYYEVIGKKDLLTGDAVPRAVMPELPDECGIITIDSGKRYYNDKSGKCIVPHEDGYTMPDKTRMFGVMDQRRLREGIFYIDDWADSASNTMGRFGVMRNDHFLATYARINAEKYNLVIDLLSSPQDDALFYYVILPDELINAMIVDLEERMQNMLPFAETEKIVFELRRHGNIGWTDKRGLDEDADLQSNHETSLTFDISYTLFNKNSERHNYISTGDAAPHISRIDNRRQMDAYLKKLAQESVDEEQVELDFASLSLNKMDTD